MAQERLIFPIGFDLESGVEDVRKQWNKVHKKLQTEVSGKPLKLKLELDTKSIGLPDLKEYIRLSKEAEKATRNATLAAKRAASVRLQQSRARVQEATETSQITLKNNQAAMSEMRLAEAKKYGIRTINEQNKARGKQLTYIQRLIQRLFIVGGLYRAMNFVNNIRVTTAEFELQRVALGVLINNLEQANVLFEQIKAAAIKSPFQIKEMVNFTKQLAAYKIGVNELFDTTMRLADISAGLGVSMDRLVLAYGQVRAAGYLRASEIRQLTEAGLPIVEELAKKISLVRGELVSAGEVMQMVSERAISFGMVKDVFEDMTNVGGMFYKMQEKQAATLSGRWSNMKDSLSIMYDEMGRTESVNSLINSFINTVKSLATNWRDVASTVKTVTYLYLGYKALSWSILGISKLQTLFLKREALGRLAVAKAMKAQIAAEKTKTVVGKLQIIQNELLIAANKRLAASTTWVTAAMWKLWAAMVANPLTTIISAVTALGALFVWLGNKSKDATDNIEEDVDNIGENLYQNIENTRKRIKDFEFNITTVKPLVEEFDTLASKTNRTNKEQERYNQLIGELASKAPDVVAAYHNMQGSMGDALEESMKQPKAILKNLLGAYETELGEINVAIKNYQDKLSSKGQYRLESGEWKWVTYTKDEVIELANKLEELIKKRQNLLAITKETREALGMGEAVALTGWKAQIQSFKKEIGGVERPLFWNEELEQIYNLADALDETAKRYKENKEKADIYDKALKKLKKDQEEAAKSGKVFDDKGQIEQISKDLEKTTAAKDLAYEILKYYDALNLLEDKKKKAKGRDTRLSDLKDQINDLTNAYKKFIELRKYKFEPEALADIETLFPSLKNFKPTYANMVTRLEQMLADVKKKVAKSPKDSVLIDMERALEQALANVKFDKLKTDLEEKLSRLADQVSKTKTAKEFYDRILGMTGDRELSATFTMSVYGETGEDLAKNTIKQIEAAFEGIDLSSAINYNNFQVNWQKLAKLYEENQDKLLEKNRDTAKKLIENAQKVSAKQMEQWAKDLEKVKTYADKRVELAQKTAEKIRQIEMSTLPKEEQDALIERYRQRETKEAIKLEYEAFKDSPAYVAMFSELDSVSTNMLNHLRDKINDLQSEWQNLDPTQLKELQSRLEKIDEQLAKRNPFKALANSMSNYFEIRKKGSRRDAEKSLSDALIKQADAHKVLEERIKAVNDAQKKYDEAKAAAGETSTLTILAKNQLNNAQQQLQTQKEITEETDESVKSAQQLVSAWDRIKKGSKDALGGINDITQALTQATSQIYEAFGSFGGDDADKELFGNIVDGLGKTAQGVTDIVTGIMTKNPVAVINGAVGLITAIANLSTSGVIYRANKEIATQQERIDSLSYAYGRLEKAMESALGTELVQNYQERINALMAQETAYLKQADAERSKGKKADQDKIKEYEDSAREAADNVKDMYSELQEYFLGTSLTSAARDFAQSWIEAYKQFGSTTDAMKEKFADMIQNMIIESLAAKVMKQALEPVFTAIDEYTKDGTGISVDEAVEVARLTKEAAENSNVGMTNLMNALKQAGLDVRDTTSGLTGISKDIASASEESILGLAAGINTQNFYISQIHADVAMIAQWVQMGGMATQGVNISDLITIQNQHLSYLPNIAANTAATLLECKNILVETTRIADTLGSVVKPQGVKASYRLNTSL